MGCHQPVALSTDKKAFKLLVSQGLAGKSCASFKQSKLRLQPQQPPAFGARVPGPGCHGGCCQCQLSGHHVGMQEPWLAAKHVGMHSQSRADLSKPSAEMHPSAWLGYQWQEQILQCGAAPKRQARQHRTKEMHCSWWGRKNPTMWISKKAKVWRKYHGSGHFTRYLSIPVALKTSVKVCSHPHSPQPSLAMLFHLCDTASQGYFRLKTRHWALLCCCDSPLPKAVTRVISSTQDSYTTSNVILWAVIRSCSPRLR